MITYRKAQIEDAAALASVQEQLYRAGKDTWFSTEAEAKESYFDPENGIACTVAVSHGTVVGFQSVRRAWEGNDYGVEPGWGIIGTHILPGFARQGIGRTFFEYSRRAAKEAGLPTLDATVGSWNAEGLAYYQAMGFVPYENLENAIRHRFDL